MRGAGPKGKSRPEKKKAIKSPVPKTKTAGPRNRGSARIMSVPGRSVGNKGLSSARKMVSGTGRKRMPRPVKANP